MDNNKNVTTKENIEEQTKKGHYLSARNLMWIGLGGIIGAGFFLASGLPISYAGPAVIIAYLLGGLITVHITGTLTMLSVNHPVEGSFQTYANDFMGPFWGFFIGWTFWISSILTIASEVLAMSIFSKLWFPNIPLGILTTIYAVIVIALNSFGLKNFTKIETIMAFVKVAVLALFILIGIGAIIGIFSTTRSVGFDVMLGSGGFFPHGVSGILESMLIVVFSYAGLGAVAFATSEVEKPARDIPKAMNWLLIILILLYIVAILMVICLTPWNTISTTQSPFVTALSAVNIPFVSSIMNAVILIAAFSVMVGTYFAAIMTLVSLGKTNYAPAFVAKKNKTGTYSGSVILTAVGLALIIIVSYILPSKIYNYIISASSYFAFLSLGIILACFLVWKKTTKNQTIYKSRLAFGAPWSTLLILLIFLVLLIYSLAIPDQRIGFYVAVSISLIIAIAYFFLHHKVNKKIE